MNMVNGSIIVLLTPEEIQVITVALKFFIDAYEEKNED